MKSKYLISFVFGVVIMFFLMKSCEGNPKVVTKTETKIVTKHDTINETIIKEVPKEVIVNKYIDKEGDKVIVYVDKENDSSLVAKQYKTEVKSNEATAKLDITTTGELLDISGVITYPEKETIKETTIRQDNSGVFLYAQMPISSQLINPELGVMLQIKNKIIIGLGANYNNNLSAVGTIAVKL